jgi:S1-C subfamily serine protease
MQSLAIGFLFLLTVLLQGDAWLGIYLSDDDGAAVVAEVIPDSPAAKAGMLPGDVLLSFGDSTTPTAAAFRAAVAAAKSGDRVRIRLRRGEREQIVVVRLGDRPRPAGAGGVVVPAPVVPGGGPSPAIEPGRVVAVAPVRGFLGLSVEERDGVVAVARVLEGAPAQRAGVLPGDVLQAIGDARVQSLAQLDAVLAGTAPGQKLSLGLLRAGEPRSLDVELGVRPADPAAEANAPSVVAVPMQPAPDAQPPAPQPSPEPPATAPGELERELTRLRKQLEDLRRRLEQLRRGGG